MDLDSVNVGDMSISGFPVNASVKMRKTANSLSVAKGTIDLAGLNFSVDGMVNYSMSTLDLAVEGKKINIGSLVSMLPEKWMSRTGGLSPSGIMDFRCSTQGTVRRSRQPSY